MQVLLGLQNCVDEMTLINLPIWIHNEVKALSYTIVCMCSNIGVRRQCGRRRGLLGQHEGIRIW